MEYGDFLKIIKLLEEAESDYTPFLIYADDNLIVVGDANKTEVKKNDYKICLKSKEEKTFKGISIPPKRNAKIIDAIFAVQPFVKKMQDNGDITNYTDDELYSIFCEAEEEIYLAIKNVVTVFLNITDADNVEPQSVVNTFCSMIKNHAEAFNENDVFFRIIYQKSLDSNKTVKEEAETFFATFEIYTHMTYYLARLLRLRPNDILDNWGVAELIVAYGQFTNEDSYQAFKDWQASQAKEKKNPPKPKEIHVEFRGVKSLEEE